MKRPLGTFCLLVVILVILSELLHPPKIREYAEFDGITVTLTGQVIKKEIKYNYLCITLSEIQLSDSDSHFQEKQLINKYNQNVTFEPPKGVVCYFPLDEMVGCEPKLGMYLCVQGEIREYEAARNPGQFDMDFYYLSKNIDCKLYHPCILAKSVDYHKLQEYLYKLQKQSEQIYDQVLTQAESSMMKSMLLGDKNELDQNIKDLFQTSGISHILAISGLHIALLGGLVYKLLRKMGMNTRIGAVVSITVIILYGLLTGMSISAFRACVMFSVRIFADIVGRTYDSLTAIMIAALFVVLQEPLSVFTAGMQLSFGAVLGIALLQSLFQGKFGKLFSGPISIFLATFPIICYHYYEYSVYAVVLNLILVPLMSVVMILGFVVLILGYLSIPLAMIPGKILILILTFYEKLSEIAVSIPGNQWVVGRPSLWQIGLYYVCMLLFLFYRKRLSRKLVFIGMCVAVCMVSKHHYRTTNITMLDVGQGDGFVLIDQSGSCITVDGGSSSEKQIGENIITPFLKYNGIDTIEYAILTHLDEDHYSGILEIIRDDNSGIHIENIVFSEAVKYCDETEEIYQEILTLAGKKKITVFYMKENDELVLNNVKLKCLWPSMDLTYQDTNAGSIVLEIKADQFRGLLTGDISANEEQLLLNRLSFESYTWLKAAHHGSKYSNSQIFLERVDPECIWISCGENNSYGHPHEDALERMETITEDIYISVENGGKTMTIK